MVTGVQTSALDWEEQEIKPRCKEGNSRAQNSTISPQWVLLVPSALCRLLFGPSPFIVAEQVLQP